MLYVTVAKAVRPSLEISYLPLDVYGLVTLTTCGIVRTCLSSGSIALRTADDWTVPLVVWNTIWSTSPPCEGNSLLSRSTTCWDSVLGRLKSLAYWRPTADAITVMTIATSTQPMITARRWVMHQRLIACIAVTPVSTAPISTERDCRWSPTEARFRSVKTKLRPPLRFRCAIR